MKKRLLTSILSLAFCLTVFGTTANAATNDTTETKPEDGSTQQSETTGASPGESPTETTASAAVKDGEDTVLTTKKGLSVKFPAGSLPKGTTAVRLEANGLDTEPAGFSEALKQLPNHSGVSLFDLKLANQKGNFIEKFDGKITVTIPVQEEGQNDAIYFDEKNKTVTDLEGTLTKEKTIEFTTDHFSIYGAAKNTQLPATPQNPNTGDSSSIMIVSIVALVAAAGLFASKKLAVNR